MFQVQQSNYYRNCGVVIKMENFCKSGQMRNSTALLRRADVSLRNNEKQAKKLQLQSLIYFQTSFVKYVLFVKLSREVNSTE